MKISDRGYWVSFHFYWQSIVHYFYYSAKFRSFTFFTASNPAIEMGGMLDDNKEDVYSLLPQEYLPVTQLLTKYDLTAEDLDQWALSFPLIVKPNIGLKGFKVAKVENLDELNTYLRKQDKDREFLLQEYLDYKKEYSLLYYRVEDGRRSGITSLIEKSYPSVIGDGNSTLSALIDGYKNSYVDMDSVKLKWSSMLDQVIPDGKEIILHRIGNYSRGSKFHSMQDQIDDELILCTDRLFKDVSGIDFCRVDFKSDCLEGYKTGAFKILEVNGAKSEPLHTYDKKHSFWDNVKTIVIHWKIMASIVSYRRKKDAYVFPSTRRGLKSLFAIKKVTKSA